MKTNYTTIILWLFVTAMSTTALNGQIIADGTYKIFNNVNSEVMGLNTLDPGDPNNPDGLIVGRAKMEVNVDGNMRQLWTFEHQGNDVYKITNDGDSSILGVKDGWCGQFGDVQAGFDDASPWTLLRVTAGSDAGTYVFEIAFDADCNFGSTNTPIKAFDIDGGNSGGKIQTFDIDNSNPNQQFQIVDPATLSLNISLSPIDFKLTYDQKNRKASILNASESDHIQFTVYNLNGQIVKQQQAKGSDDHTINFNDVKDGLYLINIQSEEYRITKKLIVY